MTYICPIHKSTLVRFQNNRNWYDCIHKAPNGNPHYSIFVDVSIDQTKKISTEVFIFEKYSIIIEDNIYVNIFKDHIAVDMFNINSNSILIGNKSLVSYEKFSDQSFINKIISLS